MTRFVQKKRGFTFIETLVAIAVLLIGVVAPLSLAYQGLSTARVARNQVTAVYLAQEGIEYVRAMRDDDALSGRSWLSSLTNCVAPGSCTVDTSVSEIAACDGGVCAPLSYDSVSALYSYGGEVASPFTRTITIEELEAGIEARVEVTMSWQEGASTRSITIDEHMFNWQ